MAIVKMVTTLPGDWKEFEVGEWGHTLVENLVVACIQIERIRSMYRWDGEVNSEDEWRLTMTTTTEKAPILSKLIQEKSPYDIPQVTWAAIDASGEYSTWTKEVTK